MELVNYMTSVCTLVLAVSAIVMGCLHYAVIMPLRLAIDKLSEAIERLEKTVGDIETRQREIDKRVTIVEQATKSAHKRIDAIVGGS